MGDKAQLQQNFSPLSESREGVGFAIIGELHLEMIVPSVVDVSLKQR